MRSGTGPRACRSGRPAASVFSWCARSACPRRTSPDRRPPVSGGSTGPRSHPGRGSPWSGTFFRALLGDDDSGGLAAVPWIERAVLDVDLLDLVDQLGPLGDIGLELGLVVEVTHPVDRTALFGSEPRRVALPRVDVRLCLGLRRADGVVVGALQRRPPAALDRHEPLRVDQTVGPVADPPVGVRPSSLPAVQLVAEALRRDRVAPGADADLLPVRDQLLVLGRLGLGRCQPSSRCSA